MIALSVAGRVIAEGVLKGRVSLLVGLLWVLAGLLPVRAVVVSESRWGLNGRVLADHFNLLSVLVVNPGERAFEGAIELSAQGVGGGSDVRQSASVYLAPRTSRWVQFHVWINQHVPDYELRWGRRADEAVATPDASVGAAGVVMLTDPSTPGLGAARVAAFPVELFPTAGGLCAGAAELVLDFSPRWEVARRQALLDWLALGGRLHVLRGPDGQWPRFEGELGVLNAVSDSPAPLRVGGGDVVWHKLVRGDFTEGVAASTPGQPKLVEKAAGSYLRQFSSTVFENMAQVVRPRIAWGVLYWLVGAYFVLIGPGHYVLRLRLDYRVGLALLAGVVGVFALAFSYFGRRGAGEKPRLLGISIARCLGGVRWEVDSWQAAFVTRSGSYTFGHPSKAGSFALGSTLGTTPGVIENGPNAKVRADIPLFSTRPIMVRAVVEYHLGVKLAQTPKGLVVSVPADGLAVESGWVFSQGELFSLVPEGDGRWRSGRSSSFNEVDVQDEFFNARHRGFDDDAAETFDSHAKHCASAALVRALGGNGKLLGGLAFRPPEASDARVFLFCKGQPECMALSGMDARRDEQRVLWVLDLKPEPKP